MDTSLVHVLYTFDQIVHTVCIFFEHISNMFFLDGFAGLLVAALLMPSASTESTVIVCNLVMTKMEIIHDILRCRISQPLYHFLEYISYSSGWRHR